MGSGDGQGEGQGEGAGQRRRGGRRHGGGFGARRGRFGRRRRRRGGGLILRLLCCAGGIQPAQVGKQTRIYIRNFRVLVKYLLHLGCIHAYEGCSVLARLRHDVIVVRVKNCHDFSKYSPSAITHLFQPSSSLAIPS